MEFNMLTALLATIDRLIQFAKGRIEGRRQMFKELLDPVFDDLASVHGNYVKVFSEIEWTFPGHYKDGERRLRITPGFMGTPSIDSSEYQAHLSKAKQVLEAKRLEFEPVRVKLRALAKDIAVRDLPNEEKAFTQAVLDYFPRADIHPPGSHFTNFAEFLREATDDNAVVCAIHNHIEHHNKRWAKVCEAYAALRVVVSTLR